MINDINGEKMKKILQILILCFIVVSSCVIAQRIDADKKKPYERREAQEIIYTDDAGIDNESDAGTDMNNTESDAVKESYSKAIYDSGLKYEFLSYEIVDEDDLLEQTKYKSENFYNGIPSSDYQVEYIDYEAVKAECPELRDMWENENDYSVEEVKQIYQDNIDYIEKYTYSYHPETKYIFIKCKITNTLENTDEFSIYPRIYVEKADGTEFNSQEAIIYFDEAENTEGEERLKRFFCRKFTGGEVLECTLGFQVQETYGEDEVYYIGFTIANTHMIESINDPAIVSVRIDQIGE